MGRGYGGLSPMFLLGILRGMAPAEIICMINARETRTKRAMVKVGIERQSLTEAQIHRVSQNIKLGG